MASQIGARFRTGLVLKDGDLTTPVPPQLLAPENGYLTEISAVVVAPSASGGRMAVYVPGSPVTTFDTAVAAGLVLNIPPNAPAGTIVKAVANKGSAPYVGRDAAISGYPSGFTGSVTLRVEATLYANNPAPQQPY